MNALNLTAKYEDYMTGLRRWFHENPELSGKEYETIRKIDAELTAMGIEHTIVENGGILGGSMERIPMGKLYCCGRTVMPCRYWRRRTSTEPVPAGAKMRV